MYHNGTFVPEIAHCASTGSPYMLLEVSTMTNKRTILSVLGLAMQASLR